jgi:hypothetical protein
MVVSLNTPCLRYNLHIYIRIYIHIYLLALIYTNKHINIYRYTEDGSKPKHTLSAIQLRATLASELSPIYGIYL